MVDDSPCVPEPVENGVAQEAADLFLRILPVQAVGTDQPYVPVLDPGPAAFIQYQGNGNLPVGVVLDAALHLVGKDDDDPGAFFHLAGDGLDPDGVEDGFPGRGFGIGEEGRVSHGLAGDEDVGAVGEDGIHHALAVLEGKFHAIAPWAPAAESVPRAAPPK